VAATFTGPVVLDFDWWEVLKDKVYDTIHAVKKTGTENIHGIAS